MPIVVQPKYLSGNPIIIALQHTANAYFRYSILIDYSDYLIYSGAGYSGTAYAEIDISSLFEDITAETYRVELKSVTGTLIDSDTFTVYRGGISKSFMRDLDTNNTNIFDFKLKNNNKNFLLSTRTDTRIIAIPEDELMPLYFYYKGMAFTVEHNGTVLTTRDYTGSPEEGIANINFATLRNNYVNSTGKLINSFDIVTPSGIACTVCVLQSFIRTNYYIKFRNSWGVTEKIGIRGDLQYLPTIEEPQKISTYDTFSHDYVTNNDRKNISNKYKCTIGYSTAEQRLFILDAIMSDSVILQAYDNEYSVNLSTESTVFGNTNSEPLSIDVIIEFTEKDNRYTPISQSVAQQLFKIFSRKFSNQFA